MSSTLRRSAQTAPCGTLSRSGTSGPDAIYIRSAHGLVSPRQGVGTGRIQSGGVQRDVAFEPVSADLADEITVTYHAKYDRYGPARVDSDTTVVVNTGIVVAGRLQSLIDSRDYSPDLLVIKVQMDQICDAVKSTVPQEMWSEIIEKLDEAEQHQEALIVARNSFDDPDDEPFDPTEFIDEDDEF